MGKKRIELEDDDFELDNLEDDDNIEIKYLDESSEDDINLDLDIDSDLNSNLDDDSDEIDIIIEVDDSDLDIETIEDIDDIDIINEDDVILSKHKLEGKHSLKYDSIFKGKKEEVLSEEDIDNMSIFYKDSIEVDKSSNYYQESIDNEQYIRSKIVKERVYVVLKEHTNINFLNNRRKPSRVDFNNYYELLKNNLQGENFTNIELFNELSVYFSDNLFNMFKLLDNKWRNQIIKELQDHIGKNVNSKEITNRNIYEGTELEFEWVEEDGEKKMITGVVIETDYENSNFKIDSYENIYLININNITNILNNTKFKYNLNKLNHIDFL